MSDIRAAAKINLFLLVGHKRPDGYHPICSLMEKVSLFDSLAVSCSEQGLSLGGMAIPLRENIISRGVAALEWVSGVRLPADIEIDKQIPVAAGLAGGSSDAAAAMMELARLYGLEISAEDLARAALETGADVPFFTRRGPQLAEGVGERLTPVDGLPEYHAVLVAPEAGLPTAEVYQLYDRLSVRQPGFEERASGVRAVLADNPDLNALASLMVNDLEEAAISMAPEIDEIKQELKGRGATGVLMSGSGPSVYGLFADHTEASTAAAVIGRTYRRVWVVNPVR